MAMKRQSGFTLLEVLIVVGIMGLLAAMVWPMTGILDDDQRERITREKMEEIRQAILGHGQLVDSMDMDRVIGGYVRDMGGWPRLWEPGPPGAPLDGERGSFSSGGKFRWERPFVPVEDPDGGSLGQPRGLWTRQVSGNDDEDTLSRDDWKGPYLTPPVSRNPAVGKHYAKNQEEYENLFDVDRAYFHLLQGDEQLLDGWNRAFRFFITGSPPETVFWIVSMGPSGVGTFSNMEAYVPNSNANRDNIVKKLHESDWRATVESQRLRSRVTERLIFMTEDRLDRIVRALTGSSPAGPNTGYTGDFLDWPALYSHVCFLEDEVADCSEPGATGVWTSQWEPSPGESSPFRYGQPRGLWRQGSLPDSRYGLGWRHAYHEPPGNGEEEGLLLDSWDRPFHFFKVTEEVNGLEVEQFLVLSGGPSGAFEFPAGTAGAPSLENRTGPFSLADYDPGAEANRDNVARVVRRSEWSPGFLSLENLRVRNLDLAQCGDLRCLMYGVVGAEGQVVEPLEDNHELISWSLVDVEGEGEEEPFQECRPSVSRNGNGHFPVRYDDISVVKLGSGGRYLVCWTGGGESPAGNEGWWRIMSVHANPARIVSQDILLDADIFETLP